MSMQDSIIQAHNGFKTYFDVDSKLFLEPLITMVTQKFDLDIIKFDGWLHKQGYIEEEHGSMREYIVLKYGKDAVLFIDGLLGTRKHRKIKRRL